jgi:hypothetical protein
MQMTKSMNIIINYIHSFNKDTSTVKLLVLAFLLFAGNQALDVGIMLANGQSYETMRSWDREWYAGIVKNGYDLEGHAHPKEDAANWAFFPAHPYMARAVHLLSGMSPEMSLIVVSKAMFALSIFAFMCFARAYNDRIHPVLSGCAVAFNPYAIYANAGYTEPLFLLGTCVFFLLLKNDKLVPAGLAGGFLSSVRLVGIVAMGSYALHTASAFPSATTDQKQRIILGFLLIPLRPLPVHASPLSYDRRRSGFHACPTGVGQNRHAESAEHHIHRTTQRLSGSLLVDHINHCLRSSSHFFISQTMGTGLLFSVLHGNSPHAWAHVHAQIRILAGLVPAVPGRNSVIQKTVPRAHPVHVGGHRLHVCRLVFRELAYHMNMSTFIRIAIGLLALYYLAVLFLAFNPNVGDDYRQYYISRTADLSPMEKKRLLPLRPGVTYSSREKALILEGWEKNANLPHWNTGEKARIFFCLDNGPAVQELQIGLRPAKPTRIRWSLNDGPEQEFVLTQAASVRLPLEANATHPGINRLAFEFPDVQDRPKGTSAAMVEFHSFAFLCGE